MIFRFRLLIHQKCSACAILGNVCLRIVPVLYRLFFQRTQREDMLCHTRYVPGSSILFEALRNSGLSIPVLGGCWLMVVIPVPYAVEPSTTTYEYVRYVLQEGKVLVV
jgi:hypothetical protein